MSIRADDNEVIRAALLRAAGADASAAAIAEAADACWQDIVAQLEPVIGKGGVRALHGRCVHLSGLPADVSASSDGSPPLALRRHLQGCSSADALDTAAAFFHCFGTLLGTLIGAGLTARLLSPVWAGGFPNVPAQENVR